MNAWPSVADLGGRIEGQLVVLEPIGREHAEGLFRAAHGAGAGLFRWMPVDLSASPGAVHDWVASSVQRAREELDVPFAILDAATGQPIGSTRFLEIRLEHLRAEIGWTWLSRDVWGRGHNVETKLLLLTRAFERARLRRVEFKTDARNERSRGALTALGAHFEGIFRKHMVLADGSPRDSAYFSVIDDEWPALKATLQARLARQV